MLDFELLRAFVAVAECGGAAALASALLALAQGPSRPTI
jgi:hypothetical protein